MTVNELIAELQVLSAQGHGELDVCVEDTERDMVVVFDVRHTKDRYYQYDGNKYQKRSKPFIGIYLPY